MFFFFGMSVWGGCHWIWHMAMSKAAREEQRLNNYGKWHMPASSVLSPPPAKLFFSTFHAACLIFTKKLLSYIVYNITLKFIKTWCTCHCNDCKRINQTSSVQWRCNCYTVQWLSYPPWNTSLNVFLCFILSILVHAISSSKHYCTRFYGRLGLKQCAPWVNTENEKLLPGRNVL